MDVFFARHRRVPILALAFALAGCGVGARSDNGAGEMKMVGETCLYPTERALAARLNVTMEEPVGVELRPGSATVVVRGAIRAETVRGEALTPCAVELRTVRVPAGAMLEVLEAFDVSDETATQTIPAGRILVPDADVELDVIGVVDVTSGGKTRRMRWCMFGDGLHVLVEVT